MSTTKHVIPLDQAIQMTQLYRQQKENILTPEQRGKNLLAISETFDRSAFDQLLGQPGCTSLRLYYGMDANLQVHAIVVGVDASGNDQLPPATPAATDPVIIEEASFCPPFCGPASPLNS